jgi:hypothetical protein
MQTWDVRLDACCRTASDEEVMLDIEVVGAMATVGVIVIVYFAENTDQDFSQAVSRAVHDPATTVVSIGWGTRNTMVGAEGDICYCLWMTSPFRPHLYQAADGLGWRLCSVTFYTPEMSKAHRGAAGLARGKGWCRALSRFGFTGRLFSSAFLTGLGS